MGSFVHWYLVQSVMLIPSPPHTFTDTALSSRRTLLLLKYEYCQVPLLFSVTTLEMRPVWCTAMASLNLKDEIEHDTATSFLLLLLPRLLTDFDFKYGKGTH